MFLLPNNSDIDECSEGTHVCDQICINNDGSYSCDCESGYTLADGYTCNGKYLSTLAAFTIKRRLFLADINECDSNNGGCGYKCENAIGSFVCVCQSGFKLMNNGRTCIGTNLYAQLYTLYQCICS